MLSIIIPALNEENYLPRLLESIKAQELEDYEIIVADSNSRDNTKKIAKKFGCKIVKGGRPPAGRNKGAKAAKGSVLFFIDADCVLKKNFFRKALNEFSKKNLDVAGCYVMPLSKRISDNAAFSLFNFWIFSTQLFYSNAPGSGIFCKKSIHEKINGFDEKIKLSEDMDYVKRAGRVGKFRVLKSVKTYTSVRRFDEEGRLSLVAKLFLSGVYRLLFGEIRTDAFHYTFRYRK